MPWRLSPFQLADVLAAERPGAKAGEMVDLASMLHIIDMAGDHVADCEGQATAGAQVVHHNSNTQTSRHPSAASLPASAVTRSSIRVLGGGRLPCSGPE